MKWFVPLLATALLTLAAEEQTAAPPDVEKAVETLKTELAAKLAKIDQAITTAAKEGGLKPSTETYFRDCLAHFQTSPLGLSEAERIYFPPRFDSTPAIEPINLAWADLRTEIIRQQREQDKLVARMQTTVLDGLAAAAANAETAAELAPVSRHVDLLEKILDPTRIQRVLPNELDPREQATAARTFLKTMGEALEARAQKKAERLTEYLKGLSRSNSPFPPQRSVSLAAAQEIFRNRLLRPLREETAQAQGKLEEAIFARKPPAEVDALLAVYESLAQRLQEAANNEDRNSNQALLRTYQNVTTALTAIAAGEQAQIEVLNSYDTAPLAHPVQYRAFLLQLRRELAARPEPRESSAVPGEMRAALDKVRAEAKGRLAAVQDAEGALALAGALPGLLPRRTRDDSGEWQNLQSQLGSMEQQLRQLGTQWRAGTLRLGGPGEYQENRWEGEFATELLHLRERAWREVVSAGLTLPELKQPPLAELPVNLAMRRLADAAADRGEWKRVLALVDLLNGESERRGMGGSEQTRAIRAYLTGLNFEQAEQFPQAVGAYQQVLMQLVEHIPLAEATERLKKLRAAHPEAFPAAANAGGRVIPEP